MIGLYGRHYSTRYRAIADLIPAGSEVLDLCCGPALLYTRYLKHKSVKYTGLDINPAFISVLTARGIDCRIRDLRDDTRLPKADYVVMQASLYHFLPDPIPIIQRMRVAARKQVIISEPIRNLALAKSTFIGSLAGRLTNPGSGSQPLRFTEEMLDELLTFELGHHFEPVYIKGGREKIYVIPI